jgi:outer membrane protein assembly factor BamB
VASPALTWIRRLSLVLILAVAAVAPGPSAGSRTRSCTGPDCDRVGTIRWTRLLPGSWVAQDGLPGTTPATGQAYAALNGQVAAVGAGTTVAAYAAHSGQPLWTAGLTGFPPGSAVVSVRVWPGLVTAGVSLPPSASGPARAEVLLDARTGRRIRVYPAAPFGGAVAVAGGGTVIVGPRAVTSYSNRTGRVRWSRPAGPVAQAWQVDGSELYVTVAAGGYLGTAPVTALRQINLSTGRERLVRPAGGAFTGALSLAFDGVVYFTSASGITAYRASDGTRLWHRPSGLPEGADVVAHRLYLLIGNALVGVDPLTGTRLARVTGAAAAEAAGLYGVRDGAMLGLDHGALGKAWGYRVATQRVVWTSAPLPWPHYFVDLSGIGGSTSPGPDGLILAVCGALGAVTASGAQACARPELVALNR